MLKINVNIISFLNKPYKNEAVRFFISYNFNGIINL